MIKRKILSYLLLPFSWIYGLIVFIRNKCFDIGILEESEFNIPIISVGNITVGGTGKTPHIEYLIRLLKDDFRLAVLSRGYKRKSKGFILADEFSDAESIGDEPFQIKSKFPGIIVAVDADRRRGIRILLNSDKNVDLILLDDAFQHRYVKPGISILMVDFNRPVSGDTLLPSGRLREPKSGIRRADIILVSKSPGEMTAIDRRILVKDMKIRDLQYLYFTTVLQDSLLPVFREFNRPDISKIISSEPNILILSGIANPGDLKQFVTGISPKIYEMYYSDHHFYTQKDITAIQSIFNQLPGNEKILITTEKDAARLQKFKGLSNSFKSCMFYIPIKIKFLNDDEETFNKQIINYVRNNKRNSILYKGKDEISA